MDNLQQQTACSRSLQPNSSISLTYHSLFGAHNDLMLLELDNRLLPKIQHQRVTFRGQLDEDAVLCTPSKTYAVKFVGTSNSMILIPPSDDVSGSCNNKDDNSMVVASVLKVTLGCMELVEVAPKLDELKLLLSRNPYSFSEASEMDTSEERERTGLDLYTHGRIWSKGYKQVTRNSRWVYNPFQQCKLMDTSGFWMMVIFTLS